MVVGIRAGWQAAYKTKPQGQHFARNKTLGYVLCVLGPSIKPDWNRLFETAGAQDGYFTTRQAADAGYSTQLLLKHIRAGRITRTRRGIYRLVHFPAGEHEELVTAWLWSERAGVISHQTALALLGLSDALPAHVHLTLPSAWRRRRFRVPADVVLHHADVLHEDRAWFGAVPTTNPRRSLNDCAREGLSPELLRQAAQQALRRGLVTKAELGEVEEALKPFGGLAA
jgi:predicted transcriptional regulator of viral defense system